MTKLKEEELKNVNGGVDAICDGATAGGIVGSITDSDPLKIENCVNSSTADTTGATHAGGICGSASGGTAIINCYNSGVISDDSEKSSSGGFVGSI